jgi:hypothetical protein
VVGAITQEHVSEDPKRVEKEVKRYKGMREHQRYAERINTAKEVLQEALARPEPFSPNAFGYTYVRPRRARPRGGFSLRRERSKRNSKPDPHRGS